MSRRKSEAESFLDDIFDLLRRSPWWFGPIVIAIVWGVTAWLLPAMFGTEVKAAESGQPTSLQVLPIFGNVSAKIARLSRQWSAWSGSAHSSRSFATHAVSTSRPVLTASASYLGMSSSNSSPRRFDASNTLWRKLRAAPMAVSTSSSTATAKRRSSKRSTGKGSPLA